MPLEASSRIIRRTRSFSWRLWSNQDGWVGILADALFDSLPKPIRLMENDLLCSGPAITTIFDRGWQDSFSSILDSHVKRKDAEVRTVELDSFAPASSINFPRIHVPFYQIRAICNTNYVVCQTASFLVSSRHLDRFCCSLFRNSSNPSTRWSRPKQT